jgi:hypothetical protein
MSEEKPKPETPTSDQAVEWIVPEDGAPEVYSDWYHVNWLPLNVRIRLGQIVADNRKPPGEGKWAIDERVVLTMPWVTTKGLAEFLTKLVAAYEKKNGEIVIPTSPETL